MKIGLYFGSFNPIHIGHLIIANYLVEHSDLDRVWMIVSPHNPLKEKKTLLEDHHRLEMVYRACESYPKLEVNDIEFKLPKPSFTVDTLVHLREKYPEHDFTLIMGEDSLIHFHKWKNYEVLLEENDILVYPRLGEKRMPEEYKNHPKIHFLQAPVIELSATAIRKDIEKGLNVKPYLPVEVWSYIDQMNFYKS
ncbi:MAG: nicotinate (nicotinamide) nucleotide adenylyltransferase [Flavobacteriaceae bacterium]